MSKSFVILQDPLEGRWAEEASNLFDIDWLLEITNGQEEYAQRREHANKWLKLARDLGLEEKANQEAKALGIEWESERVLLRNLQQFVSVTPPDQRCPCLRGLVLDSESHYPGCEWIYAARAQEAEEKKAREKVAAAEKEVVEGAKRRKKEKEDANTIADIWRPKLVVYMSTSLLQDIEEAVGHQLNERLKCFTYSFRLIFIEL